MKPIARIFKGCDTDQVDASGNRACESHWYFEPDTHQGATLWSSISYATRVGAEEAAQAIGFDLSLQ